ncbi:MAG: Gfo/Idh/MocA family oxidoreductase [Hyphomicrobiales bacterium]|nr:Gfo/Idh/MocA family oxidoreductase [Hyphomicrobiales bacterium]
MARRAAIGIIGAGVISDTYLELWPLFKGVEIVACADIVAAAAKAKADQFSVRAMSVEALLGDSEIDTVINLTVPKAHYDVSHAILTAGKHVYSEKPLTLTYKQARKLVGEADKRGLKIGAAPDTFLGAGGQAARKLVDKGAIGDVVGGTAQVRSHGMEHWHPSPGFFYRPGGGPMLDVGPYYITTLVNLLGSVKTVTAMAKKGLAERLVTAAGPMTGKSIKVTTPTTVDAILDFHSGAQITVATSWDVWKHGHVNPIELYGTKGTMLLPDPNFFGGVVSYSRAGDAYDEVDTSTEVFGAPNWRARSGAPKQSNYRMLGVADLADAARKDREPRCSGRLAAHVVDIMESIMTSAAERRFVRLRSKVERPAPLQAADVRRLSAA